MAKQTQKTEKSYLFTEESMTEPVKMALGEGEAIVYSAPYPHGHDVNQDAAWVGSPRNKSVVLAVADGVGGSRGGRVAANLAMTNLQTTLSQPKEKKIDFRLAVLDAFEDANASILKLGIGAATTSMVVTIDKNEVRAYHAGDSGCLVVGRGGKCKLKNIFHSPFAYEEHVGIVSEKERRTHEDSQMVLNVLGYRDMHIEIGSKVSLSVADRIIVGTDGLFDNLNDEEIIDLIRKGPLDESARAVVDACKKRMKGEEKEGLGKPDDLTFILYGI